MLLQEKSRSFLPIWRGGEIVELLLLMMWRPVKIGPGLVEGKSLEMAGGRESVVGVLGPGETVVVQVAWRGREEEVWLGMVEVMAGERLLLKVRVAKSMIGLLIMGTSNRILGGRQLL